MTRKTNLFNCKPIDRFEWLKDSVDDKPENSQLNELKISLSSSKNNIKVDENTASLFSMSVTIKDLLTDVDSIDGITFGSDSSSIETLVKLIPSFKLTPIDKSLIGVNMEETTKLILDSKLENWQKTGVWTKIMELFPNYDKKELILIRVNCLALKAIMEFLYTYEIEILFHLFKLRFAMLLNKFKLDKTHLNLSYVLGIDEIPKDLKNKYYSEKIHRDELLNIVSESDLEI
jgi:hypothetical protein